jgi:biotin carboxylase
MNFLLVNPFSSAKFISDFFKAKNHNTIAIYTNKIEEIAEYFRPDVDYFDKQIFIDINDINNIEEILRPYSIDFVINGSEDFTHITDLIATKLTPNLANNPNTSIMRMDKFHMHQELAKANINYIPQRIFNINSDNLEQFVTKHKISYPCFIKPQYGCGSYCVSKIDSFNDLVNKFNLFINKNSISENDQSNLPKIANFDYLVCDYIDGEEYFVDSFSYKGKHYIGSVQKYSKAFKDNIPVYKSAEMVKDKFIIEQLSQYVNQVLTALGNDFGMAHTEVKIDNKTNKPVLIELNSRISGAHGFGNIVCRYAGLNSQLDLINIILNNPNASNNLNQTIEPKTHCSVLPLFNWSGKKVPDIASKLEGLITLVYSEQYKFGNFVIPDLSTHLFHTFAIIILSSNNLDLLKQEQDLILFYDQNGWS